MQLPSFLEKRFSIARSLSSLLASLSQMPRRVMLLVEVRLDPEVKAVAAAKHVAVDVAVVAEDVVLVLPVV